jgi:hypothetical protein
MSHQRFQQDAAPAAKPTQPIMMHALRTLFALSLLAMAPAHADTPQQRWVGDLPIMDGMTIEPELGFAFDSPSGRIVLVFAAATDNEAAVLAYYDSALASFGWQGGGGSWNRGSESLTLGQVDTSVGRLWRIRLSPN